MRERVRCLETLKLEMQTEAQIGTVGRCCRAVMPGGSSHLSPAMCDRNGGVAPCPYLAPAEAAALLSGLRVSGGTLRNCRQKVPSRARIKTLDLFIVFQVG